MSEAAEPQKTRGNPFARCIGLIGVAVTLFTLFSLGSFFLYLFEIDSVKHISHLWEKGLNLDPWPSLRAEITMYQYYGYNLSWLENYYISYARNMAYPLWQIVDLTMIRLYGVVMTLWPLLCICLTFFFSGRIKNHQRQESFEFESSTLMHIYSQARYVCWAFFFFFLAVPFGDTLPVIGYIPIYSEINVLGSSIVIWYSNPLLFLFALTVPCALVSYQVGIHFSSDI